MCTAVHIHGCFGRTLDLEHTYGEQVVLTPRRFVLPILALCGSVFMVIASIFSHGIGCLWYLIVFAVIMAVGALLSRKKTN